MSDIDALPRSADAKRAAFFHTCRILDTPPEPAFDDIAHLAASICDTPMALVSLLDGERQWFKSRVGVDMPETPIVISLCAHAIQQPGLCVIPNAAKDARFWNNPLVTGKPHIRFYAGAVLETAAGVRLGVLCVLDSRPRPNGLTMKQADALQALARQVTAQLELRQVRAARVEETRHLQLLNRVGKALGGELDLERLVQTVTDAGTELTGAAFGAFFYKRVRETGERYMLYTLSGVPREAFASFPMPCNTAVFQPTFEGTGIVRSADITKDSRYGRSSPHHGMPAGHLPVRSYLAVPVISHTGEVLGGLFFGHPEAGVFSPGHEETLVAIAAHAAIAIDNARLFDEAQREIERRRVAEVALRENQGRLCDLLYTLDLGTSMARDLDGTISFWSAGCARLYGWTSTEAVGQNADDLLHTSFPKSLTELEGELLRTGEWTGDLRQHARDGRELIVTARKVLRYNVEGQPSAVLESIADMTAQHRANTGLRESETRLRKMQSDLLHVSRLSEMGQMAAMLAHELNQPLTAIASSLHGAIRMLRASTPDGLDEAMITPRVIEAITRAATQSLRAGQIVRRLREFISKSEVETRVEDVAQLVREAGVLALVGTAGSGIAVSYRFAPGLPPVLVDRIQIQQVLINLIRNAVEAMSDQECVGRSTHRELVVAVVPAGPDAAEVSVADTGPGLAPEIADRLFEAFVTTKTSGVGIGLSICRSIIEAHGGRIWADLNPGGGTVFRFTLRVEHEANHSGQNK